MIEHHFDLFRLELLADLAPEYALGGRLEESCPAAKLSKIPSRTHSGKREEEKSQKRRKEKGLPHQPDGAVCQGFAGENYARRASFSMSKRRSRLTLTGRRRQATFAEFCF